MIEITRTYYTFNELSEKAQERAIQDEKAKTYNCCDDTYEFLSHEKIAEAKSDLEAQGFENVEIAYRGFWSQGDGASFTAENIDIETLIFTKEFAEKYNLPLHWVRKFLPHFKGKIIRTNNRYSHCFTVSADVDSYLIYQCTVKQNRVYSFLCKMRECLESYIDDWQVTFSNRLYRDLENLYDSIYVEDFIKSYFKDYNGELYFDENGKYVGTAGELE